jgi:hypothetical protein
MDRLAKPAIDVVRDGQIKFHPEKPWTGIYLNWLENIRPWCISRQLWWGHQIPAWYGPDGKVFGVSKLARLVDVYARRLQTQEHLTSQVATAIDEILKPRGVAVLIEAEHTCMSVRGVAKHGAMTFTSRFTGMFRDNPAEQAQLQRRAPRDEGDPWRFGDRVVEAREGMRHGAQG